MLPVPCSVDANTLALSCDNPGHSEDVDVITCIDMWDVGHGDFDCPAGKTVITVLPVS